MKRLLSIFILLSFCLLMLSCTSNWTKKYGSSVQDVDVKAKFENYEYVSSYSYFYTGYGNGPEAIVGIKKDYELVKVSGRINVTNWQQFEPGGEKLKELVDGIKAANLSLRRPPNGYIMNVPGGDQVGVMYATTLPTTDTVIRLRNGNQITVTPHNNSGYAPL